MYQDFFGLQEMPFSLAPDTSYFFAYGHYSDALNTLLVALRTGEGFIKITGEVGTGKTLLCRKLLKTLDARFVTIYIPNPLLTPSGLQVAVAEELGIPITRYQHRLIKLITDRLIELTSERKHIVLCLDEAQAMPLETLEALRLLTNIETEKQKLLQVVLFGQPELNTRLDQPSVRQLKQRITFSHRLEPIDYDGMEAYIKHRLIVAGFKGSMLFQPQTLQRLYQMSHGIPRLINILCHKALLVAFGLGSRVVADHHMRMAAKDTEDTQSAKTNRHWYRDIAVAVTTMTLTAAVVTYVSL